MALDSQSLRLLLYARKTGADFDQTLTVGRLDLLMTATDIEREFSSFGVELAAGQAQSLSLGRDRFCEPVIEALGATTVDSLDHSTFEGATVIHDLNQPLPPELDERFSLVFDGGTLEHVFDFPRALRSCMSLPRLGGHLVMTLPANNHMGHGFYQFSPDLFYRVFSGENGYRLKGLFLVPTYTHGEWLKVEDPVSVRSRIGHNTTIEELSLFVLAERTAIVPLFTRSPKQSDYAAEWAEKPEKGASGSRLAFYDAAVAGAAPNARSERSLLKKFTPAPLLALRRTLLAARHIRTVPDPSHFKPFDPRA